MTPDEFAPTITEWAGGTMIESHGTRFVTAGGGRAVARLDFQPALRQLTGLSHAGAIVVLADETATAAARWEADPSGTFRPERFPLTRQLSVNRIRNTERGTPIAEATVLHRRRPA
jgi:acyl-coenzyme A thioesterase PaaI-like protein